jgi:hypothetical protein
MDDSGQISPVEGDNAPHRCLACGGRITWRFAICVNCEKTYGKSALQWPAWLHFLWNDVQRERRQVKRIASHEIQFSTPSAPGSAE